MTADEKIKHMALLLDWAKSLIYRVQDDFSAGHSFPLRETHPAGRDAWISDSKVFTAAGNF